MSAWIFRALALVAMRLHLDYLAEWAMRHHREITRKDFE